MMSKTLSYDSYNLQTRMLEKAQCGIIYVDEIDKMDARLIMSRSPVMFLEKVFSKHFLKYLKEPSAMFHPKGAGSTRIKIIFSSTHQMFYLFAVVRL